MRLDALIKTRRLICGEIISMCNPQGGGGVLRYISDGDVRMRRNC